MKEKLIKIITNIMDEAGYEYDEVSLDSKFLEELDFSSLEVMELVGEIEDQFEISVTDRELQQIVTVGDMLGLLEKKQRGQER